MTSSRSSRSPTTGHEHGLPWHGCTRRWQAWERATTLADEAIELAVHSADIGAGAGTLHERAHALMAAAECTMHGGDLDRTTAYLDEVEELLGLRLRSAFRWELRYMGSGRSSTRRGL